MSRTVMDVLKQSNQLDKLIGLNKTICDETSDHHKVIKAVMEAGMLVESAMEEAVKEQMKEVRDLLGPPLADQFDADEDDSKPTHVVCNGTISRIN